MTYRPTWDMATIPDDVLYAEVGRRRGAARKKFAGGHAGGRPRSTDRCPCGLMTRARAESRGHKCEK